MTPAPDPARDKPPLWRVRRPTGCPINAVVATSLAERGETGSQEPQLKQLRPDPQSVGSHNRSKVITIVEAREGELIQKGSGART